MPKSATSRVPIWSVALGLIGKAMITVGLLMLGFVAYQLWGTGIHTQQAQKELGREFEELTKATASTTPTNSDNQEPPIPRSIDRGDVIGRIDRKSVV
jgi:sortase A